MFFFPTSFHFLVFLVYSRFRGCTPLTGQDIAEIIVFAATRPENVVMANSLVFPQHQVNT